MTKLAFRDLDFGGRGKWGVTARGFRTEDARVEGDDLVVEYPRGSYKPGGPRQGGVGFYASPPGLLPAAAAAELRYRVFFPPDFDFVKGGKLPGLYVGERGASGGHFSDDAASCRVMWRRDGQAEAYVYAPGNARQAPEYARLPGSVYGGGEHGDSLWRGQFALRRGAWNDVAVRVALNSFGADGKPLQNGGLVVEINGTRREFSKMVWRTDPGARVAGVLFHTFFGGSDESWATPRTTTARFTGVQLT